MNFDKIINQGYNFNIGKYISEGFELFRKDIGGFIVATLLAIVMSFIPFCSLLAIGNFYKIFKKVDEGQSVQVGDIFDFTDFWMYFKLFFLILFAVIILMIPIQFTMIPIIVAAKDAGENVNVAMIIGGMGIWFLLFILFLFAFTVSLYFVQPIISLHKIQSVRQAYSLSWKIAKKNFFMILIFSIIVGLISQLGIIVCGIGILFTIPVGICIKYISYKDVLTTQNQKAAIHE
jgi:membrane-anchored glycerophosphoryl diester phosphodiesterase (GDPDase)